MNTVWLIITAALLLIGVAFYLIAALGIRYMPDTYLRMSAATKASTLGAASLLLAAGFYFRDLTTLMQVLVTIFFTLVTAPVAAHIIGRAGYRRGQAPLWDGTVADDLRAFESERQQQQP